MGKLHLALLWHQHQPLYRDLGQREAAGAYRLPWVRLHALRDYYSMAALAGARPGLALTINLTPVLTWQLEDYAERGATDRALELTLKRAETLDADERHEMLSTFFHASVERQIAPYPRYHELLRRRDERARFASEDLRDLAAWFSLAWFNEEFRTGAVRLVTGETASVARFVEQGGGFSPADLESIVGEQQKILRAVIPLHRALQEAGSIEISTTPYFHPILPILVDSDTATLDAPGSRPRPFRHPEDARAQIALAIEHHVALFGGRPHGMWPAEGAVSQATVGLLAEQGVTWIATDRGVLERSGRFGYRADDPNVLCRPYRAEEGGQALAVFFRERELSDKIGFDYHRYADQDGAAREFIDHLHRELLDRLDPGEDHVVSIVLDGENAWGAYPHDGRDFLSALYGRVVADPDIVPTTFSGYLAGDAARPPHGLADLTRVYDLYTGSWIDQAGSAPGVNLGTWIGHDEENRAWNALGDARDALERAGKTPESFPAAFHALYAAEGSDWFWWFGEDQGSDWDPELDALFRAHVRQAYLEGGLSPPASLEQPIAARLRHTGS